MSLPYKFFLQGRSPAARVRDTRARASAPPRVGNVPGQFYVDDTCIDCDVCRWMAPSTFSRVESASSVVQQPQDRESRISAMRAVLSCPTQSIHMRERRGDEFREAQGGFPLPVEGCPGVYHCGFHSADSFSATSYLIVREEGNIMMDCPRFNPVLARQIEQLGGVQHIVLSHIDDIADHDKWARHFNCKRIMHRTEIRRSISDIEIQLEGSGPWNLRGETIPETATHSGVLLIHTPGHTSGSICLWHEASKTMFTGDSLGYSNSMGRVSIFPRYNRAGISKQLGSIQHLLQWDWLHVLPGHGRRVHLRDATERLQLYHELVQAETATAGRY